MMRRKPCAWARPTQSHLVGPFWQILIYRRDLQSTPHSTHRIQRRFTQRALRGTQTIREEAAARAARQLDRGTDGVKIFAGAIVGGTIGVLPMRLDIAKAIVAQAHQRGKPAFAHPSNLAGLNVAIDSGVDILAHTTAEDGGGSARGWSPELVARLRNHHVALIPTMTLFEVEARRNGESSHDLAQAIAMITAEVKDYAAAGGEILFGTDVGYTDAFDTSEEYRLPADRRPRLGAWVRSFADRGPHWSQTTSPPASGFH
jgi:hypothetical protein